MTAGTGARPNPEPPVPVLRTGTLRRSARSGAGRSASPSECHDNGIEINVDVSGTPAPLDGEKERNVILFIREALQNAIRHAAAERLSISLRFDTGRLNVAVEDNGLGFDCSLERLEQSQHYGLLGMRERVERMGGEFHLTSAHGAGTTVRLQIPIGRARL